MKKSNKHPAGYLYMAYGDRYIHEAIMSASSLKKVDPEAHTTLITDRSTKSPSFDDVVIKPHLDQTDKPLVGLRYKVKHIYYASHYERTFYVDTDTYFFESCRCLFRLLDHFDVCAALAPGDMGKGGMDQPENLNFNTGVMLIKANERNDDLFRLWWETYSNEPKPSNDQISFVNCLFQSDSRIYTLSNNWNARTRHFIQLNGSVKVIHQRFENVKDYEDLRGPLNSDESERIWDPVSKVCISRNEDGPKLLKVVNRIKARLA